MAKDTGDKQKWITGLMIFRLEHETNVPTFQGTNSSRPLLRTGTVAKRKSKTINQLKA
jgi:hypothetical protein